MYLVYFDESGNAGLNLADAQQPIFVLCALLVPDDRWAAIESDLLKTIDKFFPQPRPDDFEIHANELINPRGFFRDFPIPRRLDFFKACLDVAVSHKLKVIHRAIVKKSYQQWLEHTFGAGILINPHRAAFALVAQVVNDYLRQLPDTPLGIFISDENKDVVKDIASACTLAFISEDERFNSPVLLISHTCISWFKAHPCHQRGYEFCQWGVLKNSGRSSCRADGKGHLKDLLVNANQQVGLREMLVDCTRSNSPFP